jgi:hypothetical protein
METLKFGSPKADAQNSSRIGTMLPTGSRYGRPLDLRPSDPTIFAYWALFMGMPRPPLRGHSRKLHLFRQKVP